MTIPNEAIEKAIEGGGDGKRWASMHRGKVVEGGVSAYWEVIALDPTFWQALGKALYWDEGGLEDKTFAGTPVGTWMWQYQARKFFDLILTDKSADAFWEELLVNKDSV